MLNKYKCKNCGFEWSSPEKEYEKCPECGSVDIDRIDLEDIQKSMGQPGMGRGNGNRIGAGPPKVCKCTQCGHESPKTPGVPCRTITCPECGAPLCGAG